MVNVNENIENPDLRRPKEMVVHYMYQAYTYLKMLFDDVQFLQRAEANGFLGEEGLNMDFYKEVKSEEQITLMEEVKADLIEDVFARYLDEEEGYTDFIPIGSLWYHNKSFLLGGYDNFHKQENLYEEAYEKLIEVYKETYVAYKEIYEAYNKLKDQYQQSKDNVVK